MQNLRQLFLIPTLLLAALLTGCSGGGGGSNTPPPPPGKVSVTVVDDQAAPVVGAQIQVFDAATGNPIATLTSGADGSVSASYYEDNIQLKVSAQGYAPSPAAGIPPQPIAMIPGQEEAITITLSPLDPTLQIGSISGKVLDTQGLPVSGALVTALDAGGTTIATAHADHLGDYNLYNVPAGDVTLNAWVAGLNFTPSATITVADADALTGENITASGVASGSVSGKVSFTAITGDIVDITLLQPGSREVVPGLRAYTDANGNFDIPFVPNGTFEIIASLENDGYVLDPDTSVTQGIPTVTINNNAVTRDLKATGSITLTSPESNLTFAPLPELSATPTFTWLKDSSYASADDYVIEVVDESSSTVWGGFDAANNYTPRVTVPQGNNPQALYDFDGSALSALEAGKVYQLRVYARSIDNTATGFTLLSSSETLDGLFRVATAP